MVITTKKVLFGVRQTTYKTIFFMCCYTAFLLKINKKAFYK